VPTASQPSACSTEPVKAGALSWRHFVSVSPGGEVSFRNHREMDWYVGADGVNGLAKPLRDVEDQEFLISLGEGQYEGEKIKMLAFIPPSL
jgi:hypothetical protein